VKKILLISTGGTFNKIYDPIEGNLKIDKTSESLKQIASKWLCEFEIINIIGKDSLEMTTKDRMELLLTISASKNEEVIVIHGTDTMDVTASYLADATLEKKIILTGAMVPYSIDPVEATANLASAYGYLLHPIENGIYISMHGNVVPSTDIHKDRVQGKFICR
jgi:L-asparaginase